MYILQGKFPDYIILIKKSHLQEEEEEEEGYLVGFDAGRLAGMTGVRLDEGGKNRVPNFLLAVRL